MTARTKYPRTFHFPWSPGRSDDDKVHSAEAVEAMCSARGRALGSFTSFQFFRTLE